jgi:hypothetical protein
LLISDISNYFPYKCSKLKMSGGRSIKVKFNFRKNAVYVLLLAKSVRTVLTNNV